MGRKLKDTLSSGGTVFAVTQYSYDAIGRLECTAVRMNPAEFASLPASACTLDTQGTGANDFGPDRITRNVWHVNGQVAQVQEGYATSDQASEVTRSFTASGQVETLTDAEGNRTTYEYDAHDRLVRTRFPSPTTDGVSAPTSGTGADYEELTLDPAGNVTNRRLRDAQNIG